MIITHINGNLTDFNDIDICCQAAELSRREEIDDFTISSIIEKIKI